MKEERYNYIGTENKRSVRKVSKTENIDLRIAIDGYVEHCVVEKAQDKRRENLYGQLSELEAKAAKWDMIQWAIDKVVAFVECEVNGQIWHTCILGTEIEKLQQLYKEREQVEHSFDVDGNERMRGTLG